MIIYTPPIAVQNVPIINLELAFSTNLVDRLHIAEQIHSACRDIGFFYIRNHGVDQKCLAKIFALTEAFFNLSLEQKLALHMNNSPSTAGYEPMGAQILDSQDKNSKISPPDIKESFYCGLELPDDHPLAVKGIRAYGHNQWPGALPDFRPAMLDYYSAMVALGQKLMSLLALSLQIEEDWFVPAFRTPSAFLRLIHYPPQPDNAMFNQIGAGAHTDWGGITILAQDSKGGLEVRNVAGEWIEAPPIEDTFVINLGDLMSRWTNGIYTSNMHRVLNNRSGADRYSVPFFLSPQPETRIDPIPGCVSDGHPQRYPSCSAAEHMGEMFRRSYGYSTSAQAS